MQHSHINFDSIEFSKEEIAITDPCYNKSVWCRINDIPIVSGLYQCSYTMITDPEDNTNIKSIEKTMIVHNEYLATHPNADSVFEFKNWEYVGEIGVDSGMAGFFQDKPNFSNAEWSDLCNSIDWKKNAYLENSGKPNGWRGFWTGTNSDGGYPVYGIQENGRYVALAIVLQ